jgi:hypothetical protein
MKVNSRPNNAKFVFTETLEWTQLSVSEIKTSNKKGDQKVTDKNNLQKTGIKNCYPERRHQENKKKRPEPIKSYQKSWYPCGQKVTPEPDIRPEPTMSLPGLFDSFCFLS